MGPQLNRWTIKAKAARMTRRSKNVSRIRSFPEFEGIFSSIRTMSSMISLGSLLQRHSMKVHCFVRIIFSYALDKKHDVQALNLYLLFLFVQE